MFIGGKIITNGNSGIKSISRKGKFNWENSFPLTYTLREILFREGNVFPR